MNKDVLKALVMMEIINDEREYCFDPCYCDDATWFEYSKGETREEGFKNAILSFYDMSLEEIFEYFGDKYDYVKKDYYNKVGYKK